MLFDRELALCSGVNADRLVLVLLVVIAVAIGGAIRLTADYVLYAPFDSFAPRLRDRGR